MAMKPTARARGRNLRVPPEIADALNRSTDDLLHDRIVDGEQYLKNVQKRVDAYLAKRKKGVSSSGR